MNTSSASTCGAIRDASGGMIAKLTIHLTRNCHSTGLNPIIRYPFTFFTVAPLFGVPFA
jgi:hypothetical protein